jgi:hypothetical protein
METDSLVSYAASVVLAAYPSHPQRYHRRSAKYFFKLLFKLFGLADGKPDTRSRDSLTMWGFNNFEVWRNADYAASSPKRWGPHMWRLMFACANLYTPEHRDLFRAWLKSLRYLLPCVKCAGHYRRMLSGSKDKWKLVSTNTELVEYIAWMHAKVKRRVQKERKFLSRTKYKNIEPWPVMHAD